MAAICIPVPFLDSRRISLVPSPDDGRTSLVYEDYMQAQDGGLQCGYQSHGREAKCLIADRTVSIALGIRDRCRRRRRIADDVFIDRTETLNAASVQADRDGCG